MALAPLDEIKLVIRENEYPMFSEVELQYYLDKNEGSINDTIYECLIMKSENSTIQMTGLNASDTSSYFKRLASRYRPNNSGILGR